MTTTRLVIGLGLILLTSGSSWAQKSKNNQEKKDDQKVNAAQQDVKQAQDKLRDAERDRDKAQAAKREADVELKSAGAKLKKTRDQVESKLEKENKVESALADQLAAQQAYDRAKEPVLTALKAKPEHQAAVKAADAARAKIKDIRGNLLLAEAERTRQLSDASLATLLPSKLEQVAVDADPAAKDAKAKLTTAADKVAALREKIRKAVESDGEIKAAQKVFDQAKLADDKAKDKLATEVRQAAEAAQKLAREQARLAQAKAQDKANDGKNKKNKK
jgi:hypothetical protein